MSAAQHLMNVVRDRKINILMLESGEDCSVVVNDLLPTLQMLGLAAKYQNVKNGFAEDVHLGCAALLSLIVDFDARWQPEKRDVILTAIDSAIDLNKRLQLRNIVRAQTRLEGYSSNMAVL